jgi:hydroxyacylglutathione hydrolase
MTAIIPIPAFADNYIWLPRESGVAAVVDPGKAEPVLAYLERERLELAAIVNTHHHGDHGGNRALLARRQVPVFGPAHETIPGVTRPRGGRHVLFAGHRAHPIRPRRAGPHGKLAALPADTRVFCGPKYTLANLRFAQAVEPANALLRQRQAGAQAKRDRGEPTVPWTIAEERARNAFLRVRR